MIHPIVARSVLFNGLDEKQINKALRFFNAYSKKYTKGENLNVPGEKLNHFGLVMSGNIQVCMDDLDGFQLLFASVEPGGLFGESLCFLAVPATVYIRAVSNCEILWMDTIQIQSSFSKDALETELTNRFISVLAQRTLSMNDRIQVLSRNPLRARIKALLAQYERRIGETFEIPFNRTDLAIYLGANRSAVARELTSMQKDGIIHCEKKRFTILLSEEKDTM